MNKQLSFQPEGLSPSLFEALEGLTRKAVALPLAVCVKKAADHLVAAVEASRKLPLVNVRLAQAIFDCCQELVNNFAALPAHSKGWIKGAILYFAQTTDGAHDFETLGGFEDDCEVLNACLRLAHREDLIINPEDYD